MREELVEYSYSYSPAVFYYGRMHDDGYSREVKTYEMKDDRGRVKARRTEWVLTYNSGRRVVSTKG